MVRRGHLIALVRTFLIGCAVLLLAVGCAGTSSESSNKKEQGRSPEATASEEARCEGTSSHHIYSVDDTGKLRSGSEEDMKKAGKTDDWGVYTTNDLPGCPNKGGPLSGTDKKDKLDGKDGDDEIRGLGAKDYIFGRDGDDVIHAGPGDDVVMSGGDGDDVIHAGPGDDVVDTSGEDDGDDVIYGGDGDDEWIGGGNGEDVIYGGDGIDFIFAPDDQPDKLYCGKGKDYYYASEYDQVSSSCEEQHVPNA